MRFTLYISIAAIIAYLIMGGFSALAARFDWSKGQPTIIDDNVNTTKYDWSKGQPTVMYQFQAAGGGGGSIESDLILFD